MIVLITGGSKGIGRETGIYFKEMGYKVLTADILACDYSDKHYNVDLSKPENVSNLMSEILSEFNDIEIVINNVGVGNFKPLEEQENDDFINIINTNLTCAYIISREFAKHRLKNKNKFGRIINISSTRYLMSEKNSEGYAASKGGIVSLTHALAVSLSDYNITVNCISPGWIQNTDYDNISVSDHRQHPSGRVGKPSDIAKLCVFLSKEENDFINGENIIIDGGMTRKMIYI